jgi:hypothetical protein
MKNKITCLLAGAALFGATANAEIVLAEGLSASGYIDIVSTDGDIGGGDRDRDTTTTEFELGLSFAPAESKWSAVAELSFGDRAPSLTADTSALEGLGDDATPEEVFDAALSTIDSVAVDEGDNVEWETVTISYQYSDALSFTFGNIYTYQGLESHDAPNNYFISYAGLDGADLYSADFATGVSADYSAGDFAVGVWAGDAPDSDKYDLEYYVGYTGIENLSLAVALTDNENGNDTTNLMATYEYDAFTLMVEDVDCEVNNLDVLSVSVAYSLGDTTYAVRLVDGEYDNGATDYEKFSVAAFHSLSDNAAVGVEYSEQDDGTEEDELSVELLYVF